MVNTGSIRHVRTITGSRDGVVMPKTIAHRGLHIAVLAASFLGAQAVVLWLLLGPLASQPWLD